VNSERPPNRLIDETSPYLLQHAHNPVDWYPWGEEALRRAREEDKPIFLSVGYSACHWCHVMERECFEDESIAALMNSLYVNVKVDREERPDIDEIYMKAVTALGGGGGWPMSVFLTPQLEPFFGGTYFPPVRKYGRPGFPDVLIGLAEAWQGQREQVTEQAAELTAAIRAEARADLRGELPPERLDRSLSSLLSAFDATWGGFGAAPKFPHAGDVRLLLRHHLRTGGEEALHAALHTLQRMADGGIHDQLGGGFHRYSVDERFCIPHFEKMLYDNAQLIPAYLEAYLASRRTRLADVARDCCEWALREMRADGGAFASAQDADSEGEEGKFFVWTPAELRQVLGERDARMMCALYDVTDAGNFEGGRSALWMPRSAAAVAAGLGIDEQALHARAKAARDRLLQARQQRVAPATDDKVLAAWNGLMIGALAMAAQVLDEPRYASAAREAAGFVLERMRDERGRLRATARARKVQHAGCLDDHAFVTAGLLDLFETDFDERWLREALSLSEVVEAHFADAERGGYFTTADDHEALIARTRTLHDGALPAGTAVQALNLLRLSRLTGRTELESRARRAMASLAGVAERHPRACATLLMALDFAEGPPREVVISGEPDAPQTRALLAAVRESFSPRKVVALARPDTDTALLPLCEGRTIGRPAAAYVCRDFVCAAPTSDPRALADALQTG
jgi:hypothetical protein